MMITMRTATQTNWEKCFKFFHKYALPAGSHCLLEKWQHGGKSTWSRPNTTNLWNKKTPALQARWRYEIMTYCMASSVSRQDESNPVLWLATRAGKMALSCPLRTTCCVLQGKFPRKPYDKSFIDQACSVKMAEYWPCSFFGSLWTSTTSRSINSQKKNLTNIQPSGFHTWSITHIIKLVVKQMECSPQELNIWPCEDRLKLTIMKTLWYGLASISLPSFMHYSVWAAAHRLSFYMERLGILFQVPCVTDWSTPFSS